MIVGGKGKKDTRISHLLFEEFRKGNPKWEFQAKRRKDYVILQEKVKGWNQIVMPRDL